MALMNKGVKKTAELPLKNSLIQLDEGEALSEF